jgi:hypothetical protein
MVSNKRAFFASMKMLVALAVPALCGCDAALTGNDLHGAVSHDKKPVMGGTVWAFREHEEHQVLGISGIENGQYRLSNLPEGPIVLCFTKMNAKEAMEKMGRNPGQRPGGAPIRPSRPPGAGGMPPGGPPGRPGGPPGAAGPGGDGADPIPPEAQAEMDKIVNLLDEKYGKPENSDVKYTVHKGDQTFDIEFK